MTTYVEGLRDTVRAMERVGIDASDMKEVFTAIGQMIATDAASLAPHKTGRLSASIRPTKTKNKAAARAGSARAPYAGAINYGWPKHGIRASLFMQRAIDQNEAKAVSMMEDGLGSIITKNMGT